MGKNSRRETKKTKNSTAASSSSSSITRQSETAQAFPYELLTYDHPHNSNKNKKNNKKKDQHCSIETLLPGYIWVVPNFLTQRECQAWIDHAECSQNDGLALMSQRGNRYLASRECFRMQRNDKDMAARLFTRIIQKCPDLWNVIPCGHHHDHPVACNPNIRLYKYTKGQSFGKHIDESNVIPGLGHTKLTILIYLSSCQGGATRFDVPPGTTSSCHDDDNNNGGSIAFLPEAGAMLLHLHGDDCLLHQAEPVQSGIKYILRTDLVYGNYANNITTS